MRIVKTDNFNRDYQEERFILGRLTIKAANEIAAVINKHCSGPNEPEFYKVVNDDYILDTGFEP